MEFFKHGPTMGEVAEVILECCEPGNRPSVQLESGHAIGDALLCIRDDLQNGPAQLCQRALFGLVELRQVVVDLLLGHGVKAGWEPSGPEKRALQLCEERAGPAFETLRLLSKCQFQVPTRTTRSSRWITSPPQPSTAMAELCLPSKGVSTAAESVTSPLPIRLPS